MGVKTSLALLVMLVCLSGCGETADESGSANDEQQAEGGAAQREASDPQPACKKASKALLSAIEAGLEAGDGGRLRHGYIARSKDFEKVYMVAADIQGAGLEGEDDIGVWATNSPSADGTIFAVDAVAQEFSDWGDADTTDAAIDNSADGVDQARTCAEK